jgi:uncharacterized protein YaeQ
MALTATIYTLGIDLSDIDRGVYEKFSLKVARQPSETAEYMLMRVIAYCCEYAEGIELTEGVAAVDEPAVVVRDLTGRITAWIEIGLPDPRRLHRGSKLAGRAAIYTHRDVRQLLKQLEGEKVHRSNEIPIYVLDGKFVEDAAASLDRRAELSISINDRELWLGNGTREFSTAIVEHRLA